MGEEACEGAGRAGREGREARLEAPLVFSVFSKETMTKLCVGVFVLDILIYILFIYPVMTKRAHDTLSLSKSITRLEVRDRFVDSKRQMKSRFVMGG